MRISGAIVSAAVIAAALALSASPRAPRATQFPRLLLAAPAAPEALSAPTPVEFVVRFRGRGPIARAQAMAARGRESAAARRIVAELDRQRSFNGLCFDRFTVAAAEVVLKSCADVPAAERAAVQTRWLSTLNAMRSVEYANSSAAMREM